MVDLNEFKSYRKKNYQLMRPYIPGEDMIGVSVSCSSKVHLRKLAY